MTQKVITLVHVKGQWRLKTPSGTLLDASYSGSSVEAEQWAQRFCSSWYNIRIELQEDHYAQESRFPE